MPSELEQNSSNNEFTQQAVDLSNYAERIADSDDRTQFNKAIDAANSGNLRLAYIGIWITIIESLRSRIIHQTEKEWSNTTIDDEAKEGFRKYDKQLIKIAEQRKIISRNDQHTLDSLYELRNLYVHANGCEPIKEYICCVAAASVDILLHKSKFVNLDEKEQKILCYLLNEPSYLKDSEDDVQRFVDKILPELNKDHYSEFLEYYLIELGIVYRSSKKNDDIRIIFHRGIWFFQTLLLKDIGIIDLDNKIDKFKYVLSEICGKVEIFENICEETQNKIIDTLIQRLNHNKEEEMYIIFRELYDSKILSESQRQKLKKCFKRQGEKQKLEEITVHQDYKKEEMYIIFRELYDSKILSGSQRQKLEKYFKRQEEKQELDEIAAYQDYYNNLIANLKSYNWYIQEEAIDKILQYGVSGINRFVESEKIILGRNILQAAEGNCFQAIRFIEKLAEDIQEWPIDLIHGIAIECFANENSYIRFKSEQLNEVLQILDQLDEKNQKKIIDKIIEPINAGKRKNLIEPKQLYEVIQMLEDYTWAKKLSTKLRNKAIDLLGPPEET